MEETPEGAWRSFLAVAICLPAFLALRLFGWAELGQPEGGLGRALAAELIGYVVAWTAFSLATLAPALAWGRAAEWPRFLCAWNWANVVQYLVLLALMVPVAIGVGGVLAQGLTLAGIGYAVWLEWFVTRHALGVSGMRASLVVLLDLVIGLFVHGVVQRLGGG
jgi:hypothetical protein